MWSIIPAVAILVAQAAQPSTPSKSYEWCFERGKGEPLCKGDHVYGGLRKTTKAS